MASNSKRVIRETLVQAAASAAAQRYAEIIPLPAYGMVFDAYFSGGAGAREFAPLYEVFRTRDD